jgi:general secretion pathway protein E
MTMIEASAKSSSVSSVSPAANDETRFLSTLVDRGLLTPADVNRLARTKAETGETLCRLIPKLGLMEEKLLAREAAAFLKLPLFDKEALPSAPLLADALSESFLEAEGLLPVALQDGRLIVASSDPFSDYSGRALALAANRPVAFVVGTPSDIDSGLRRLYAPTEAAGKAQADEGADVGFEEDIQRLKDMAAEAPVIRFVNQLFQEAVEKRSSDIHLEPFHSTLRVRFRIDGHLREMEAPHQQLSSAVISRLKLLARLNIAERRLPQDGRIRTVIKGKTMDVRVSTVPALYGESVVMRLLDKTAVSFDFNELGLSDEDLGRYLGILSKPNGILLVTGPTGSGKTTTLYASLLHLNKIDIKILTVEDPIEYELPGINQIQVKPQIGLGFANALRSLVRQDPDVILIGEIRDLETAEIASQSALTGHRVLSTLHTNDAASSVMRLIDMGLADFLIAATVRGIVAQRLVRRLCDSCKKEVTAPSHLHAALEPFRPAKKNVIPSVFEPQGCHACEGAGYRGRLGIYEVLVVSERIREMIQARSPAPEIQAQAIAEGMTTLYEDGLRKASRGMTSIAEVLRATQEV